MSGLSIPPRPSGRPSALRAACWRGDMPAEALPVRDREELVYELWLHGWTDVEIATHTRMSTYTASRIRERLGLVVRTEQRRTA